MKKALLIIDVQKAAVVKPEIVRNIEKLQYEYDVVYASKFTNTGSPLLEIMDWTGYDDETLAFAPKKDAIVFIKTGYTSYLPEMKVFDEIHLCGFDTDACVLKTALDLFENNYEVYVLKDYCMCCAGQIIHNETIENLKRLIGREYVI